jgi:hypothetical protein
MVSGEYLLLGVREVAWTMSGDPPEWGAGIVW